VDGARGAEVELRKRWHPSGETFFYEGRLSPPEIPETCRRQLGVAHCVLNVAVPKVGLQGASVVSLVRQRVATGMPEHVRMRFETSGLLKLYIYGYLNRVQSSRRLEREAGRNVEVMWLTCRLVPDHKTIADFRKDSGSAIKKVCVQFIELCRESVCC
jgi:hypothetical protein